jgi:hypothetical protein
MRHEDLQDEVRVCPMQGPFFCFECLGRDSGFAAGSRTEAAISATSRPNQSLSRGAPSSDAADTSNEQSWTDWIKGKVPSILPIGSRGKLFETEAGCEENTCDSANLFIQSIYLKSFKALLCTASLARTRLVRSGRCVDTAVRKSSYSCFEWE